ncbi:MFS transporter [Microbacterium protaetiae]|uniref:MFS transporter n=1 Tax=Microbacterium protaetiae TaxID=2509458 RepID=A0A4P6EC61_9MICO|nr:MFS transporter [Microbacterium protaetiae]QAY58579.1 MFS transporter [Microbacterium protaetiae]
MGETTTSPPATAGATSTPERQRSGSATIAFAWIAMLVSYLPFSAVNGGLGLIGADAQASTADLQWVTDAFTVALVAAVLAGGRLGDRFGRRRTTLLGLVLTSACSAIGLIAGVLATAPTGPASAAIPLLWLAQAVGGVGAGLVMSATLPLIVVTASTPAARDRAVGVWAAANVIGLGGGPFITGAATAVAGWPALFVPTGILALATIAFGLVAARESRSASHSPLHLGGLVTGVAGTVLLVFGAIRAGSHGWVDAGALVSLAGAVLLLAAFVAIELRSRQPIIDPRLFRSGAFSAAGLCAAVALFAMVGLVFVVSVSLAHSGVHPSGIALQIGCLFAGNVAASIAAGPLLARVPASALLIGGLLIAAAGSAALLTLAEVTSVFGLSGRLIVIGIGCGFTVATAAALAVRAVPPEQSGMAGVANNTLRQIGGALGAAVIGAVFTVTPGDAPATGDPALTALHTTALLLVAVILITSAISAVLMATTRKSTT